MFEVERHGGKYIIVLIVPLWIEITVFPLDNHIQNPSFNRTFMELKFISCFLVCSPIGVLIVPLWN